MASRTVLRKDSSSWSTHLRLLHLLLHLQAVAAVAAVAVAVVAAAVAAVAAVVAAAVRLLPRHLRPLLLHLLRLPHHLRIHPRIRSWCTSTLSMSGSRTDIR